MFPSWSRGRFLPFLVALALLFLVNPLLQEAGRSRWFRILFALTLLAGISSVAGRRRQLLAGVALGVPATVAQGAAYASPTPGLVLLAGVLSLLFLGYATSSILAYVLRSSRVTGDTIAGAICVFLLLGLIWTLLYGFVLVAQPGAYSGLAPGDGGGTGTGMSRLVYFSFVTLTTLGYGDITPLSPVARTLAWIEAVVGQLYLAILVARLVGLHIAGSRTAAPMR